MLPAPRSTIAGAIARVQRRHVDPAAVHSKRSPGQRVDDGAIADVAEDRIGPRAQGLHSRHRFTEQAVVDVVHDDRRALFGETARDAAPDATPAAGDDGDLPFEQAGHSRESAGTRAFALWPGIPGRGPPDP
jgi:hypothetical protein